MENGPFIIAFSADSDQKKRVMQILIVYLKELKRRIRIDTFLGAMAHMLKPEKSGPN